MLVVSTALSEIAPKVGLSPSAVNHLMKKGIDSPEEFLGVAFVAPEELAQELDLSVESLNELLARLQEFVPADVLRDIKKKASLLDRLPMGAELTGYDYDPRLIAEFDEE